MIQCFYHDKHVFFFILKTYFTFYILALDIFVVDKGTFSDVPPQLM